MKNPLLRILPLLLLTLVLQGCPAPTPGTPPTAGFTATPVSGTAPLTVQFTDASTAGTSEITGRTWNFGDGFTSTEANPAHIYGQAGTYSVTLTVNSADGSDDETKTNLITVSADPAWPADTETFSADVAEGVNFVPEAELGEVILQYNQEERAYLLDADGVAERGLDISIGQPLVLAGFEIGRITVVDEDNTGIYIETEEIPLNEVFPNAQISWDRGIEFTPDVVKSIEIDGVGSFPVKQNTPIEINFEQGEYKYELKVNLGVTTADFDFAVSKTLAGAVKGKFTAKGQIVRFRSKNQISIQDGQLASFGHELNGMRGTADLKLIVAASGGDAVDFKLPVPIMKIPFVIGYIPATLNIGAQFVVNAAVPLDGSAQVGTTFNFDSDLGFTFNGTSVEAGGRIGDVNIADGTHMTGASTAISANFGIGYPRVSLDIAGGTLVPWAQTAFLVGDAYTFTPPCQSADAQFIGAAGYNLGVLGFDLASGSVKLFEQKKKLLRAGQCSDKDDGDETPEEALSAWALGVGE